MVYGVWLASAASVFDNQAAGLPWVLAAAKAVSVSGSFRRCFVTALH